MTTHGPRRDLISQIYCRFSIIWEEVLGIFWQDMGVFTLTRIIFVWFNIVNLLVMFSSSKGKMSAEITVLRRKCSQIASLDQQIRSSRPLLGRSVQSAPYNVTTKNSRSVMYGGKFSVKFNFGVGKGGGGGG